MLLLEKLIKLLSDDHYNYFREGVKNISLRSYYPLTLVDLVDRELRVTHSTAWFCKNVYGLDEPSEADLHKFRQLASYTFKMVAPLSNNFPNFLEHNLTRVFELVNQGQPLDAMFLCEMVVDVAAKIEDWSSEQRALEILAEREVKRESSVKTGEITDRIDELLRYQLAMNDLLRHVRSHFHSRAKPKVGTDPANIIEPFIEAEKSDSHKIRLIARFYRAYAYYFYRHPDFKTKTFFSELEELSKELESFKYITPPPFYPLDHRVSFLQLNHLAARGELDSDRVLDLAQEIHDQADRHLFWNSFVNLPEIFSLAVQLSHYSTYHFRGYTDDLSKNQSPKVRSTIQHLTQRCEELLALDDISEEYTVRHINLTTIYAGYLILGEDESIKRGMIELENLLISFQQVPFHAFLDTIYCFMLVGSFALHDYEAMDGYFKRYKKATNGKAVNRENDLTIHALYYVGKWISTGRKQYEKKLGATVEESLAAKQNNVRIMIHHILEHFSLNPFWQHILD